MTFGKFSGFALQGLSIFCGVASYLYLIDKNDKLAAISFHVVLLLVGLSFIWLCLYKSNAFGIYNHKQQYALLRWTWSNETDGYYESLRVIKSLRPFLKEFTTKCCWTGDGEVKIYSETPYTVEHIQGNKKTSLAFQIDTVFGETYVLHYALKTRDVTGKQMPYVEAKIKVPTEVLVLEAVLLERAQSPVAKVTMRDTNDDRHFGMPITESVVYNEATRTYSYTVLKPRLGKTYSLIWDRA